MKFLENEKLAQLTAEMTDAVVGSGEQVINGRIEAFIMKRAGTDKKLAHELGERYQAEIQVVETEFAQFQKTMNGSSGGTNTTTTDNNTTGESSNGTIGGGMKRSESNGNNQNHASFNKRVRIETIAKDSQGRRRSNSIGIPVSSGSNSTSKNASITRKRSGSYDIKSILKPSSGSEVFRSRSDSFISNPTTDFIYSPLGDFHDSSTQRLMTDLILTLNASFPDYDFSNIRPSHFTRLPSPNIAINRTNERLSELNKSKDNQGPTFFAQLWNAIDEVIGLNESEVYSYVPPQRDDDDDPLGFLTQTLEDSDSDEIVPLWTLNYFFVNKSMKRIVLFTCVQTMRNEVGLVGDEDGDDDNFVVPTDEGKESVSFDNYGFVNTNFRSSKENSALENDNEEGDDDDDNWNDFDMDTDVMGQPAPPVTMA